MAIVNEAFQVNFIIAPIWACGEFPPCPAQPHEMARLFANYVSLVRAY
jgi:hypothetical protein